VVLTIYVGSLSHTFSDTVGVRTLRILRHASDRTNARDTCIPVSRKLDHCQFPDKRSISQVIQGMIPGQHLLIYGRAGWGAHCRHILEAAAVTGSKLLLASSLRYMVTSV
jgi:hypothetical protein